VNNIEFIKNSFEYAGSDYELTVYPKCTHVKFPGREHSVFIEEFFKYCPDNVCRDLLQSAIEGVEEFHDIYINIIHMMDGFYHTRIDDCNKAESKDLPVCDTRKEAKRAALTYIYEQEIKL
jgi:hypothetical protein